MQTPSSAGTTAKRIEATGRTGLIHGRHSPRAGTGRSIPQAVFLPRESVRRPPTSPREAVGRSGCRARHAESVDSPSTWRQSCRYLMPVDVLVLRTPRLSGGGFPYHSIRKPLHHAPVFRYLPGATPRRPQGDARSRKQRPGKACLTPPQPSKQRHKSVKLLDIDMPIQRTSHSLVPHTNLLRVLEGICFWHYLHRCSDPSRPRRSVPEYHA